MKLTLWKIPERHSGHVTFMVVVRVDKVLHDSYIEVFLTLAVEKLESSFAFKIYNNNK